MNATYKQAHTLVQAHASRALRQSGDPEQALELLRQWGESDTTLAASLVLVGCQAAINEGCRDLMEA